jgi:hypothetical protein
MQKLGVLVFVLLLSACGRGTPVASPAANPTTDSAVTAGGTPSPYENAEQAEIAVKKGLQGDPEAAWGLAFYFKEHGDSVRAAYWERAAVLNLSGPAIVTLGGSLLYKEDVCSKMRGIYLIEFGLRALPADQKHHIDDWMTEVERAREAIRAAKNPVCLNATPE